MSKPLYVFDMDDTLVNGDCAMLWNAFLVEKSIATAPEFLETDKAMMALYARGEMDMEEYLAYTLEPITAIPVAEIHALVEEFVTLKVLPNVFPEAIKGESFLSKVRQGTARHAAGIPSGQGGCAGFCRADQSFTTRSIRRRTDSSPSS